MPQIYSDASNISTYGPVSTFATGNAAGAVSGGASATGLLGMGGSGLTAGGVGGAINGVAGVFSDLASASADQSSASEYEAAANVALQNEQVVKGNLVTQLAQGQRAFDITMGAQQAQIAAAGFSTTGGTSAQLARTSTQQFNVNNSTIESQGYLTEQGYAQQAQADENAAKAAKAAAGGSFLGAGFSAVSAIASVAMMA